MCQPRSPDDRSDAPLLIKPRFHTVAFSPQPSIACLLKGAIPEYGLRDQRRSKHLDRALTAILQFGTQVPRTVLTSHSFRSKFHPDLASSASHVDDAQESLRALQESADASPNPHLKSAVSGVSALWQIAKVGQCVGFLPRCMFYLFL